MRPDGRQPAFAVDGIAITNDGHTLLAGADGADALFDRYRDAALRPERSRSRARGQDCRAVAPALRTELFSFKPSNEMCMTYLRYRPEIEQPEPQGQETIDSIIRGMTQQTETVEQRERHAARANHAKSSALATGTIEIAAGLPPEKVKLPVFARSNRASYVIAPDGKVIFVYSALDPAGQVEKTLAAVKPWRSTHTAT